MKPRLLDLFCHKGGAAMGYHLAGFEVVGVDILDTSAEYPFEFHQGDAVEFLKLHGHEFDAIHASPPCQRYSKAQRLQKNEHPDLIEPTREALQATQKPWVMENVPGSPLVDPEELCGAMFGLRTYRHRLFETGGGFSFEAPEHPKHTVKSTKMGRPVKDGEFMHVVGNFTGVDLAREIMQMPWVSDRKGLAEAIPPAYTQYIGRHLIEYL